MKRISSKTLQWVRLFHLISVFIWALNIFLVAAFEIKAAIIPMFISLVVMNVLNIIRTFNE